MFSDDPVSWEIFRVKNVYWLVCGDDGRNGEWIRSDFEWNGEGIFDAEEGAEDSTGEPWFVELGHVRLMGFQAWTKASIERRRLSRDDRILLIFWVDRDSGSAEVTTHKHQQVYLQKEKEIWIDCVRQPLRLARSGASIYV